VRFEEIENGERTVSRRLERVQWIEGYVSDVRALLPPMLETYAGFRRLRNALVLTVRACVVNDWQSSYVVLTAAAEALLTSSHGPGLVGRLADAFARLTASSESERKAQRDHFKYLYSVRSKIMHGRSHDRRSAESNLKDLAAMGDAVRDLWSRILVPGELRAAPPPRPARSRPP
jgi:hypothetical protein